MEWKKSFFCAMLFRMKSFHPILPSLCAILMACLTGCSTPQTRSEEKSAEFNTLPKKFKEAALKGELREGMNSDAVFVALGKPSRVLDGVEKGKKLERWVYTRTETEEVPAWHDVHERDGTGRIIVSQRYDPIRLSRVEDALEVKFENGKVVGWQKL